MKLIQRFTFDFPRRRVADKGLPTQHVVTVSVRAGIRLEIDTEALAERLGAKAFRNRGGKAKLADGLVVAVREEVPA
jgi:hypothetical protein